MRHINLIPKEYIWQSTRRIIRNSLIISIIVFISIAIVTHILFSSKIELLEQLLNSTRIKAEKTTINNVHGEINIINDTINNFLNTNEFYIDLIQKQFNIKDILITIGNIIGDQIWLNGYTLDSRKGICEINGFSPNTNLVSEFMLELKRIKYFNNIKLTSMKKLSEKSNSLISFRIVCVLK